ncbi:MAG: porin PorA family protein, partial [Gordonia sp. (in: high G+C Gram-positive bacteria)]
MKQVLTALLALVGAACIAAAIAIPAWLVTELRVVPLDLDITSVATTVSADGSSGNRFPAVLFDRCSIKKSTARTLNAHLTQQRRTVIVDPSDRRQATVQSAQTVRIDRTRDADGTESQPPAPAADGEATCDDGLLTATIDRVSLNRKTSVPNGTVSSLQLEAAPEGVNPRDVSVQLTERRGFQYKFGFDVKKRSYLYYDLYSRQDTEAKFVGE